MNDNERAKIIAENIAKVQAELKAAGSQQESRPQSNIQKQIFLLMLVNTRLKRGLSQAELARRAGMQQSAIARIESGRGNPSLETLLTIAKALNVNLVIE